MAQTEKRLVGEDAALYLDDALTTITGNAITALTTGNFYRVVAKAGSTTLPAGSRVGGWFVAESAIVPAVGDIVQEAAPSLYIDVTGYSVEASKSEIDVTTLADVVKAYRAGKTDMTGTFEGIRTLEDLAATGQIARNAIVKRFLNVITQDNTTVTESGEGVDTVLWLFCYLNDASAVGDIEEVLILPCRLTGMTFANVSVDGAQTFSGSFRVDGSLKPVLLQREIQS